MVMTKEEIIRHYLGAKKKKEDIQVLAELNDVHKKEIETILIENGVLEKTMTKQQNTKYDPEQMRHLYDEGLNDREIAEKMGCTNTTVLTFRQKNNLPPNAQRRGNKQTSEKVDIAKASVKYAALAKIQNLFDMVSPDDGEDVTALYLDLMTAMLDAEIQRITNKKSRPGATNTETANVETTTK